MSGCDRLIVYEMVTPLSIDRAAFGLEPLPTCNCDHGEDDPCCSETETPEKENPE